MKDEIKDWILYHAEIMVVFVLDPLSEAAEITKSDDGEYVTNNACETNDTDTRDIPEAHISHIRGLTAKYLLGQIDLPRPGAVLIGIKRIRWNSDAVIISISCSNHCLVTSTLYHSTLLQKVIMMCFICLG